MSNETERTIAAGIAEELSYLKNGESAGDWCREADIPAGTGRWLEQRILVLRHDDGTLWGLDYARGLTEEQESELPWRDAHRALPLTRLYRLEQIEVRYATSPPPDPDAPADLVDRAYELLYAALGEHDLIWCPTTETGPSYGVEAWHVNDIAERLVRALRALEPQPATPDGGDG